MTVSLTVGLILATALLSSVLTLLLTLAWWRVFLKARLEAELEALANRLRERVKEGVTAAGQELLPAFRQEVEAGFRDALTGGNAANLIDKTAGTALRTGVALVSQGLDLVRTTLPESDQTAPTPERER
ncbi:MAG TPA: hypothetical protein VES89_06785 [Candidatus Competibacteraceae bacterium]|nr:hypothetical protein [Candidatus Competibacteraceae bacterium]